MSSEAVAMRRAVMLFQRVWNSLARAGQAAALCKQKPRRIGRGF
jgi:hypothetical protein